MPRTFACIVLALPMAASLLMTTPAAKPRSRPLVMQYGGYGGGGGYGQQSYGGGYGQQQGGYGGGYGGQMQQGGYGQQQGYAQGGGQ